MISINIGYIKDQMVTIFIKRKVLSSFRSQVNIKFIEKDFHADEDLKGQFSLLFINSYNIQDFKYFLPRS